MSELAFQVNLTPADAYQKVRDEQDADLVHEEFHDLGEGRCLGTLIFERYYFRTKNRAALVVLVDNLQGVTEVRAIATGSSEGLFFNIDWGASENFVRSVERILRDFIR
ncbi:DUF6054 family protein [Alicyclobacillus macrosporangiidus]|uniref:Uncharacterized protein n=1 Tax=Alicyclobacillus macrosporangiidus TaxID=392015 RepID=A0A1I7HE58_9BACL|nr:DUF6054 family protein [Alicyclobacillus macrosporangiidus]SFU59014.1 hypothetical protein SAMN05421543_104148 [Alicyclobacillus macrosporangiidus]